MKVLCQLKKNLYGLRESLNAGMIDVFSRICVLCSQCTRSFESYFCTKKIETGIIHLILFVSNLFIVSNMLDLITDFNS